MIFDINSISDDAFEFVLILFGLLNTIIVGIVSSLEVAILFLTFGIPINLLLVYIEANLLFKGNDNSTKDWDDPYGG